jgi:probable HAF family extracellular repeat protein
MKDLGSLGAGDALPRAMNDSGQVVGNSGMADGDRHAFFYDGEKMVDLNEFMPSGSPWTLYSGELINDAGQIVALGRTSNSWGAPEHTFLLTPVAAPEPSTLALLASLAIALFAFSRRWGRTA